MVHNFLVRYQRIHDNENTNEDPEHMPEKNDSVDALVQKLVRRHKDLGKFTSVHLVGGADVPIIKVCFAGVMADISVGQVSNNLFITPLQLGGMCTLDLMNHLDGKIGRKHLLKRSVLLLKAFFTNEVSLLGA